ncbi:transposase [Streptomyces sp. NPDC089424]|uniref:transposase n=1 Tax=Streptomyces sp. NPDC089424 TaxID=3365917 RepID=UPI00381DB42F
MVVEDESESESPCGPRSSRRTTGLPTTAGVCLRAARRGPRVGSSPVDRVRPGSKHRVIADGQGIPLAVSLTGQNRSDATQLLLPSDKIPAWPTGPTRKRPDMLFADRGYDHDQCRRLLQRRIRPVIAERGQPHGTGPRAPFAGSSSTRSPGCTASDAFASGGNATTSTNPCADSPPP